MWDGHALEDKGEGMIMSMPRMPLSGMSQNSKHISQHHKTWMGFNSERETLRQEKVWVPHTPTLQRGVSMARALHWTHRGVFIMQRNHVFFFFYCCSSIVFCLSPTPPHHPSSSHLSPPFPLPPIVVHVSFIIVPINPSPFSPIICPPLLITVNLFAISMSLAIFCLLVHFVN